MDDLLAQRPSRAYPDYGMSDEFNSRLTTLRAPGRAEPCAIMCAETLWWRCDRRIIADYLVAAGEIVFHILRPGQIERASMTSAARVGPEEMLTYPADALTPYQGQTAI